MPVTNSKAKPKKEHKRLKATLKGCERLNVRKRPNSNAEIVSILDENDAIFVDSESLGNKFYKVHVDRKNERPLTDERINGYCMAEFLDVPDAKEEADG